MGVGQGQRGVPVFLMSCPFGLYLEGNIWRDTASLLDEPKVYTPRHADARIMLLTYEYCTRTVGRTNNHPHCSSILVAPALPWLFHLPRFAR